MTKHNQSATNTIAINYHRPKPWSLNKLHKTTGLTRRRLQKMLKEEIISPIPRICRTIEFDPETTLRAIIASSPSYCYLCNLLNEITQQSNWKPQGE